MILQATIQCVGVSYGEYQIGQISDSLSNISFSSISAIDEKSQSLDLADFNLRILGSGSITNCAAGQTYTMTVTAE